MDCVFCRIASGAIPVNKVFEDELTVAFEDLAPQAPVHILVIPKQHIASLAHTSPKDESMLGHMLVVAGKVAEERGLGDGYRSVINTGKDGGQTVPHIHLHILGGRKLAWPPG